MYFRCHVKKVMSCVWHSVTRSDYLVELDKVLLFLRNGWRFILDFAGEHNIKIVILTQEITDILVYGGAYCSKYRIFDLDTAVRT